MIQGTAASIWAKLSVVLTIYTIYNQIKTLNTMKDEIYANVPEDLREQFSSYLPKPSVQVASPIPGSIAIPTYAPKTSAYEHLKAGT